MLDSYIKFVKAHVSANKPGRRGTTETTLVKLRELKAEINRLNEKGR